ncbi:Phloem protein 2 [Rhynchospora pubera]|uniref:Phloem protein 2 n=1 Tax=Rhynchospora pubera TaxID=906938 RepID=A0AAV8E3L0_9POAL|nr:Protein phloem protein 2-like a9 [Rhynchospora pubera]KAJ4778786.1 Phloem protein 2 [Rhynchospora pubera]
MASSHRKGSGQGNIEVKGDTVIVNPLALDITWGGDGRYWRIEEDRRIAELIQVCWLEVNGSVEMNKLQPNTRYKLEFKIKLKPDAFGWNDSPVYIMAMPGKGTKCIWASADLSKIRKGDQTSSIPSRLEFTTPSGVADDKISFGLFEIWKGRWKGGLVIEEVVISKV